MQKISRLFAFIGAIALAIGITVIGSSPASAWEGVGYQIQNKATGLCLTGTSDTPTAINPVYEAPCGSKPTQYWGNWTNMLVLLDSGAYNICLTANSYGDLYTTGCQADGDTGWSYGGQGWKYGTLEGDYTTLYSGGPGCYVQALSGPAYCMKGFTGDDKQFRFMEINLKYITDSDDNGRVRFADFDGDGKSDYITLASGGAVSVWLNRGGDGHGGWQELGQIATGATNDRTRVRFADFDGDGRADYLVIADSGAVSVWLNRGGDGHGGWQELGQIATGATNDRSRVKIADFDGDGKADYIRVADSGAVSVWLNRGGDGHGGWQELGQVATGATRYQTRVRLADFDGDRKADYATIGANGSVQVYLNRGGDGRGGWQELGQVAAGVTTEQSRVRFADFTGDGHADFILTDVKSGATSVWAWNGGDGRGGWQQLGQVATGVAIG
ncbi:FG-GAP-like repeat-containing protein [Streptomyces sp. R44]|uniref:FG-GAP-like repeat-containing protein n=1 Tax=Streptomyces sp. R44 TaxID=3238633 RepID=A0AB39SNU1_9ACTN